MSTVQSAAYREGFKAALEAAAKVADYWGDGNWKAQDDGRIRFFLSDLQAAVNTARRGIAEEIRALAGQDKDTP